MPRSALSPVERRLLNHWEKLAPFFGMSRTSIAIISLMSLRQEALSVYDLSAILGVSRSALSPCLREAQHVGALRVIHVPGKKMLCYEMPLRGINWLQWRAKRMMVMLVEPSIRAYEEALQSNSLHPTIADRVRRSLAVFQRQRVVLHAVITLDPERLDALLSGMADLARRTMTQSKRAS